MTDTQIFRQMALAFPEATEAPHFEKTSFRVRKKIFATYDAANGHVCVKLPETEQDVYSGIGKQAVFPVPGKWGKQGWTYIHLKKVPEDILKEVLTISYCAVAPKKLSAGLKARNDEP